MSTRDEPSIQKPGSVAATRPQAPVKPSAKRADKPAEHGGPAGPEPTRYGDWERNGRCVDF